MKRVLYSVAAVLIMAGVFTGCGDSGSNGSGVLQTDEYGVYEDGKCIAMAEELDTPFFFEIEMQYDYKGRELSTKRGIKIGSTVRELADAYKDCEFQVAVGSELVTMTAGEFIENLSEYKDTVTLITTYVDEEGNLYTWTKWKEWSEPQGGIEEMYQNKKHKIGNYTINFILENGIVEEIQITYTPDMLELIFG
ncbi:hypothetical protein [Christensenella tenuis]|uniref:Uncharacterized protein n=1 Tax=Christensenella tenuis TaxID=2763033 RepID=A0ABR7EEP4_9FIRM|nr:hypothetical protein [Christensenella tenuis]MBC5648243.1 hypothetical protein [Christensenella tenuis]